MAREPPGRKQEVSLAGIFGTSVFFGIILVAAMLMLLRSVKMPYQYKRGVVFTLREVQRGPSAWDNRGLPLADDAPGGHSHQDG